MRLSSYLNVLSIRAWVGLSVLGFSILGFSILALSSLGCSNRSTTNSAGTSGESSAASASNRIFAVSYPLQFLTQQIVGDQIEVLVPFESTSDPRTSKPTRETIEQMQQSDLVIANGIGARYAKWLAVVSVPDSKIINTASHGLALTEFIALKGESIVHSHGPKGEHSHPVMAARTWLDPSLAKKQANYIAKHLKQTYPDQADRFDENLNSLQSRLDGLVGEMDRLNALIEKHSPVVFGDSKFAFFTRAAGYSGEPLKGLTVDLDKNDDELLTKLKSQLAQDKDKENPGLALVEEGTPLPEFTSHVCRSLKIQPVEINLLDHRPSQGDYISVMKSNIARVAEAIGPE